MVEECLVWENYTPVHAAIEDDVVLAERLVGLPFPDDYRKLLLRHQGMAVQESGRAYVRVHAHGHAKLFASLLPIRAKNPDRNLDKYMERMWHAGYPRNLLHFADSGGASHFALDYFGGLSVDPTVVYVNSEAPASDRQLEEWRSGSDPLIRVYAEFDDPDPGPDDPSIVVFHVGSSVSELLLRLIKSPDDA